MLADEVDAVVGVDTHKERHTAAFTNPTGALVAQIEISADLIGYERLLVAARDQAPGQRAWAIEGVGSYGAGLAHYLAKRGERVIEIDRPKRPARRSRAKSDALDAHRAAREALGEEHPAIPRQRGWREALRVLVSTRHGAVGARSKAVCALKAAIVSAPEPLRGKLRGLGTQGLLARCSRMRIHEDQEPELRASVIALRSLARRALELEAEAAALQAEIKPLVEGVAPELLEQFGVGPICAAQLLVSYSHHGRFREEGAFASLAGAAPIPASSGKTTRHRLNRGGDRQLNRALHTVILTRLAHDAETKAYVESRRRRGRGLREIRRSLVRYLARRIYRLLQANPALVLQG
jgi:transposase